MPQGGANQDIQRFPRWVDRYMTLLVDPSFERFRKVCLVLLSGYAQDRTKHLYSTLYTNCMNHDITSTIHSHVHTTCGLELKDWSRSWGLAQATPSPIINGIDDGGEIRHLSYGDSYTR
jgi:hypothetical protein